MITFIGCFFAGVFLLIAILIFIGIIAAYDSEDTTWND